MEDGMGKSILSLFWHKVKIAETQWESNSLTIFLLATKKVLVYVTCESRPICNFVTGFVIETVQ